MVTSTDACELIECQSVTVLGEKFFFKEYNTLERPVLYGRVWSRYGS